MSTMSRDINLREIFNNKKFIFIFTFAMEFIFYYFFEELMITGNYLLGDLWLAPIFGLSTGSGIRNTGLGALAGNQSAGLFYRFWNNVSHFSIYI